MAVCVNKIKHLQIMLISCVHPLIVLIGVLASAKLYPIQAL